MGTEHRAAPVAFELFFLWIRSQKFFQHLLFFLGRNIIIKQYAEDQILQPDATCICKACVLFDSLLKCFHFPVWVTSKSIRFSIRCALIGIFFLFSCCTRLSSTVGYLAGSARASYSILSVQGQQGLDPALPPLATVRYHNFMNEFYESSFTVLCVRDI